MLKRSLSVLLIQLIGLSLCLGLSARTQNLNGSHTVVSSDGRYLLNVFHTESRTWVKALRTSDMGVMAQWQIDDFRPNSIEFSPGDSSKVLISNTKRILTYLLNDMGEEVIFEKLADPGTTLVDVSFSADGNSVVWATEGTVSKSTLDSEIETKLASTRENQGSIKAVIPLNDDQYIVLLENDSIIHIYSRKNTIFAKELKGHQRPVAGASTPDRQTLFSIDVRQELIVWDLNTSNIISQLRLGDLNSPALVEGVSLDDGKTGLLVKTNADPDGFGKRYAVSDLVKGIVNPSKTAVSMTDSGRVYRSSTGIQPKPLESPSSNRTRQSNESFLNREDRSQREIKPNSYYDLAKIEADNENYEAALNFIKRVSENDPEYRQSRELRKNVMDQIDIKNALSGAVDQYKTGNYKTAKIILENILAKSPEHKTAKRYLRLTEDKLSPPWLSVLGAIFLLLVILAGVGAAIWKFKPEWLAKVFPAKKKVETKEENEEEDEPKPKQDKAYLQRKAFILKLNETRQILKKAISLDSKGRYKDKWLEFSAYMSDIEKRAKMNDKRLPGLSRQLDKVQERILKLAPAARPAKRKSNGNGAQNKNGLPGGDKKEDRKNASSTTSKKKKKLSPHQILGISEDASIDAIKQAYRRKLKEYHPDKHESSDFKWVKEEADRMTRLIQDAYDSLIGKQ